MCLVLFRGEGGGSPAEDLRSKERVVRVREFREGLFGALKLPEPELQKLKCTGLLFVVHASCILEKESCLLFGPDATVYALSLRLERSSQP